MRTLRHIAAAVHVVDAVAEMIASCQYGGSRGGTGRAAAVKVLETIDPAVLVAHLSMLGVWAVPLL